MVWKHYKYYLFPFNWTFRVFPIFSWTFRVFLVEHSRSFQFFPKRRYNKYLAWELGEVYSAQISGVQGLPGTEGKVPPQQPGALGSVLILPHASCTTLSTSLSPSELLLPHPPKEKNTRGGSFCEHQAHVIIFRSSGLPGWERRGKMEMWSKGTDCTYVGWRSLVI